MYETHTSLSFKWMHGQLSDKDFLTQANKMLEDLHTGKLAEQSLGMAEI